MRKMTIAAALAALALAGCKVEVNDHGKLPEVDVKDKNGGGTEVDVQPGRMPDVDVKSDSTQVPNLKAPDIKAPDVKLPDVKAPDVHLPDVDRDTTHRQRGR
ncbi:MAG TPA: hypothetical protein VF771_07185 [Longimicrobiaceae bacterium]